MTVKLAWILFLFDWSSGGQTVEQTFIVMFSLLKTLGTRFSHNLNISDKRGIVNALKILGPVVQSIVSLTSSLRVISLTVLAIQYTIF